MRGVNKVIIIGNLGADPETRQFNDGGCVSNISVATSEQWTDKQTGQKREATEWHRVSLFNRLGEIAAQYLRKGSKVYIEGSLRTRKYQDQNGQDRYITEIRAESLQMLDSLSSNNQNQGNGQGGYNQNQGGGNYQNNNAHYNKGGNNQGQNNNQGFNQAPAQNNQGFNQGQNNNQGFNQAPAQNNQGFNQGQNHNQGFNQAPQNNLPANTPSTVNSGPVDDDIPFSYISNELVGII